MSKQDSELARVLVLDADSLQPRLLGMRTLPFGAVGSVGGFLRVTYALWFIGVVSLKLAWTAFYDDYTLITSRQFRNSRELAASSLFDLLDEMATKLSRSTRSLRHRGCKLICRRALLTGLTLVIQHLELKNFLCCLTISCAQVVLVQNMQSP